MVMGPPAPEIDDAGIGAILGLVADHEGRVVVAMDQDGLPLADSRAKILSSALLILSSNVTP